MQTVPSLGAEFDTPEGQLEGQGRLSLSERRVLCGTMFLILSATLHLSFSVSLQLKHLMPLYCGSDTQGV